jgi:hypothetical protein
VLDLAEFAAPVVAKLPLDSEENVLLSAESVPAPPSDAASVALSVGGTHEGVSYGNVVYSEVRFAGPGSAFRDFGVLVFAAVLHRRDVVLHFTGRQREEVGPNTNNHPVARLRIDGVAGEQSTSSDAPSRVRLAAQSYDYWPDPDRDRFALRDAPPGEQPTVAWDQHGDRNRLGVGADEATGFGLALPSCVMAELLLDIGHPGCPGGQFSLEGHHGFGGAGVRSAQIQLYVSDEPWGWLG